MIRYIYTFLVLTYSINAMCQDTTMHVNPIIDTSDNSVELDYIKPLTLNSSAIISSTAQPTKGFEINPYKKNLNTLLALYNVNKPLNQFKLNSSSVLVVKLNVDRLINLHEIPMDKLQREAAMNMKLERDRQQTELYRAGRDLNIRTFELYNSRNRKK